MSGEIVVCPRLPQALLPFALSVEEPIKTRDADTAKTTDFANRSGGEYHLQRRPGFFAQPVVFAASAAQALLPFASSVEEPIRTRVADTAKTTDFANRSGGSTTFNVDPGFFAQPMVAACLVGMGIRRRRDWRRHPDRFPHPVAAVGLVA